ncbi:ferritin [Candidatus Peregrinibacteria bacterium]|nr:ferritin [Candidatus Peregrinibacteria bacterium]
MGTKGRELVKMDVDELIELLNKALADEWLAYYQYWTGAKVVEGAMRGEAEAELIEHANDELRHADMLVERIIQLGGVPLLDPKEWYEKTNCEYLPPTDPSVIKILEQNIEGEQCAIDVYRKLTELTRDKDEITYFMVLEILKDEVEHEEDLQTLLEDIEKMHK